MKTKNQAPLHHGEMPNITNKFRFNLIHSDSTKVHNEKDMTKVLEYFRYKTETTLSCAVETGILRNSITYYVSFLEHAGLLQAVAVEPDRRTGFHAKHYSSDPSKWKKPTYIELSLFNE